MLIFDLIKFKQIRQISFSKTIPSSQVCSNQFNSRPNIYFLNWVHTLIMRQIISQNNWNICVGLNTKLSWITNIDRVMRRIKACVEDQYNFLYSTGYCKKHQISKYSSLIHSRLHHVCPPLFPFLNRIDVPSSVMQCSVFHVSHPYPSIIVNRKSHLIRKTVSVIYIENS